MFIFLLLLKNKKKWENLHTEEIKFKVLLIFYFYKLTLLQILKKFIVVLIYVNFLD